MNTLKRGKKKTEKKDNNWETIIANINKLERLLKEIPPKATFLTGDVQGAFNYGYRKGVEDYKRMKELEEWGQPLIGDEEYAEIKERAERLLKEET